jgi:hypothetical protein
MSFASSGGIPEGAPSYLSSGAVVGGCSGFSAAASRPDAESAPAAMIHTSPERTEWLDRFIMKSSLVDHAKIGAYYRTAISGASLTYVKRYRSLAGFLGIRL